jgi:phosphatidylglycerol lysyltransferase
MIHRDTLHRLKPLLSIPIFVLALWGIHHELALHSWREVAAAITALPHWSIAAALALTVVNFALLTGYDTLGLRYVGHRLPYRRSAFASFLGYAFSNALGFPLLTSAPLRYRLYSGWGLSAIEIRNLVAFYTVAFWLGFAALGGIVFLWRPAELMQLLHVPVWASRLLAVGLLAAAGIYLTLTIRYREPIRFRTAELVLPRPTLAAAQVLVAALEWLVNASVLYLLLPGGGDVPFPTFVAIYLAAQVAGVVSHVPGGLGVFEAVMLTLLPEALPAEGVLGSLLVFRAIFYLLPLLFATLLLAIYELRQRAGLVRASAVVRDTISSVVPLVFGVMSFVAGLVLLVSGATPAASGRLRLINDVLPLPVIEISHLLGSIAGAALLILAWGLQRRLDAAWYLAMCLLALGAVVSVLKGFDYEEAVFLTVMLGALGAARAEFYRRGSLLSERFSAAWTAAIGMALLASAGLMIFAQRHVDYTSDVWWRFALRAEAPRALRAEVGAFTAVLAFAVLRLIRPARPVPAATHDADLKRIEPLVAKAPSTSAHLALLGDKSLLISDEGDAFLMYAVAGRSWVAMGDPVGPPEQREELAWHFRELADEHDAWPVFYQVHPESLPLYVDLGLVLLKLGEEARVPLAEFTLQGGAMKKLRQQVAHTERAGAAFEVVPAECVPPLLAELREISDDWLARRHAREKRFSLGFFDPAYLSRLPLGIVRHGPRIEAFANVWLGGGKHELSVDLMRYRGDALPGVMDFLLVQLMRWGRDAGYGWFNLGMAPLGGFESRPLAPLWTRLGASVQRMGEHFYHFQGLRDYKNKFHPVWEPRYLASPGGLAVPLILTNLTALIGGGARGTLRR